MTAYEFSEEERLYIEEKATELYGFVGYKDVSFDDIFKGWRGAKKRWAIVAFYDHFYEYREVEMLNDIGEIRRHGEKDLEALRLAHNDLMSKLEDESE